MIKPDVFAAIMDFFTSGVPVVNEESIPSADTGENSTDSPDGSILSKDVILLKLFL